MTELKNTSKECKYEDSASVPMSELAQNLKFQSNAKNLGNESSKKKRNRFTFQDKVTILEELKCKTPEVICQQYRINERTLREWRRNQEEIFKASKTENLKCAKKMTNTSELDDALYSWLLTAQSIGISVTGPMMRQKAKGLNNDLGGPNDFKASEGWLHKWKIRKNIRTLKTTGEKLSADEEDRGHFKEALITKQQATLAPKEFLRWQFSDEIWHILRVFGGPK